MKKLQKFAKSWYVKNDGTQEYFKTVIAFLNNIRVNGKWGNAFNYYGYLNVETDHTGTFGCDSMLYVKNLAGDGDIKEYSQSTFKSLVDFKTLNTNRYEIKVGDVLMQDKTKLTVTSVSPVGAMVGGIARSWAHINSNLLVGMYKLTKEQKIEKWCVKITSENFQLLEAFLNCGLYNWGGKKFELIPNTYLHYPQPEIGFHSSFSIMNDYVEINTQKFTEFAKKLGFEFVGYKLKPDSHKFVEAVKVIAGIDTLLTHFSGVDILANTNAEENLKKANVLDKWFKPVYTEPVYRFKVGDVITITGDIDQNGWLNETKERTFKITEEPKAYFMGKLFTIKSLWGNRGGGLCAGQYRLATEAEIKKASKPHIIIRGYEIKYFDDYVEFGCQKFTLEYLQRLRDMDLLLNENFTYEKELCLILEYYDWLKKQK